MNGYPLAIMIVLLKLKIPPGAFAQVHVFLKILQQVCRSNSILSLMNLNKHFKRPISSNFNEIYHEACPYFTKKIDLNIEALI